MGYRSDVILGIAPEAAPAFMALTAKHPGLMQLCNEADKFESGFEQEGDWFMFWSSIKWYESYEEIDILNQFIEAMALDDLTEYGMPDNPVKDGKEMEWAEFFRFIKLGEDNDDTTDSGYAFTGVHINRSIDW